MNSDLIAIANTELAERLQREAEDSSSATEALSGTSPEQNTDNERSFKQDIWKAVYVLNIMRYVLAITLLIISAFSRYYPNWEPVHPKIFLFSTICLLISAVAFTSFSKKKSLIFNWLILLQFSIDVALTGLITHSFGSIDSNFSLLFFAVVGTGSVVLPRLHALGLASGAIIVLFYEHFYSVLASSNIVTPNYGLLAQYGVLLFTSALLISYLAKRIRLAELQSFVPGNESIEDFLLREETNALKAALLKTGGNKTEAAKLLGMTFRSFRYKLTKYGIS